MPSMPDMGQAGGQSPMPGMNSMGMTMPALDNGTSTTALATITPAAGNDDSRKRKADAQLEGCWYYMNNLCNKGAACKFSHDAGIIALAREAEVESNMPGLGMGMDDSAKKRKAVLDGCWYYMKGLCHKGTGCPFSHDPDMIAAAQKAEDEDPEKPNWKTEMCRFWVKKRECRFGAFCFYAHSDQELRKARGQNMLALPAPIMANPMQRPTAHLPTPGVVGQNQSFIDRLEAGLGQAGGGLTTQPSYGASSTAAALLGGLGGLGTPAVQQNALTNPLLQQYQLAAAAAAQPAAAAAPTNPADVAAQYQLQLQQYLASVQLAAMMQTMGGQPGAPQ